MTDDRQMGRFMGETTECAWIEDAIPANWSHLFEFCAVNGVEEESLLWLLDAWLQNYNANHYGIDDPPELTIPLMWEENGLSGNGSFDNKSHLESTGKRSEWLENIDLDRVNNVAIIAQLVPIWHYRNVVGGGEERSYKSSLFTGFRRKVEFC